MTVYDQLRWVVQVCGPMGGWEAIAAFDVEVVAVRYATECHDCNKRPYRVIEVGERVDPFWHVVKEVR
jgi:hypothetical protein